MRQIGQTANPLSPQDVLAYLEMTGVPKDDWSWYFKTITVLDKAWMDMLRKTVRKDVGKGKGV